MITLALNYAEYSSFRRKKSQEVALSILDKNKTDDVMVMVVNYPEDKVVVPSTFKICKGLKRDPVEDFGAERKLPYIKEILDLCVYTDCDILGYINSDVLIPQDFFDLFKEKKDAYLFSRTDIGETDYYAFKEKKFKVVWNEHPGCDAFFFNTDWWVKNRKSFDDNLIIGEATWDSYYMALVPMLTKNYMLKRAIYHTYHDGGWSVETVGGKHNIEIWHSLKGSK